MIWIVYEYVKSYQQVWITLWITLCKGWVFLNEDFIKIWEQALEILKEEISPVGYKTYVEVMIPRLSDENTVCFLAPSNYHIEVKILACN